MKLIEAINMIDEIKPNGISLDTKIRWLSELDGKVKTEIIDTHKGGEKIRFKGYTDPAMTHYYKLLIPYPYDDVYLKWLEAQIDYANGEIARYNNAIALYNTAMAAFANYYNRYHIPLNRTRLNFFGKSRLDKPFEYENNASGDYYKNDTGDYRPGDVDPGDYITDPDPYSIDITEE